MAPRFSPTLFDKLVSGETPGGLADTAEDSERGRRTTEFSPGALRFYTVPNIERFGESALQATVRREIAWLLNTTNLGASVDLEPYPEVERSVLNYGVPDLAGHSVSEWAIQQRAAEIQAAIAAFEPRLDPGSLAVTPRSAGERENAVTYVIEGEVHGSAGDSQVRFLTDVETDTGAVSVRE
jgi:type VI secretion system protein ImpF